MSVAKVSKSTADPPRPEGGAELRGAPRFRTMMRSAKLVGQTGEYPCVIRDVSETGLRLKLFHSLPEPRLALELAPGVHYFIEAVWERGSEAGFRFSAPIEIDEFLGVLKRKAEGPLRLKVAIPGIVNTRDTQVLMSIRFLSQQDADVETGVLLANGETVVVTADGLPPILARVSGRLANGYRVTFDGLFGLEFLAGLVWAQPRWQAVPGFEPIEIAPETDAAPLRGRVA